MAGDYFNNGYLNAMDRFEKEFDIPSISGKGVPKPEALIPIREIGVSIMATRDAIQPLIAKIREGASKVEIGFMGSGKGSIFSGQITPEGVDAEQRQAIREIAKINKVELSTHASVGTGGFAGFTNRGFDDSTREQNIQELKRAIDFAADTAQGGAITVHMDEFVRPISEVQGGFLAHPDEKNTTTFYLVNEKTGDIIRSVSKDVPINTPIWRKAEKGERANEFGEALDNFNNRVPKIKKDENGNPTDKFDIQTLKWEDKNATNDILRETEKRNRNRPKNDQLKPEQVYYEIQVESKKYQLEGERLFHMQDYDKHLREKKTIEKNIDELKAGKTLKIQDEETGKITEQEIPAEQRKALIEKQQDQLSHVNHQISRINSAAISYQEQLQEFEQQMKNIKPMEKVALGKSTEALGRAGLYAYDVEQAKGLNKNKDKPLFIAPENLFAEKYGSHPDELKALIEGSREQMKILLQKRGMKESEAQQIAGDHIKATLDIGHLNTWRKYFQAKDANESIESRDKRFNTWVIDKIKELNKGNIIGHIHITDNFGYHDEHLTPGQGNAPIMDFIKEMQKHFKDKPLDLVVEPGAQDPAKQYEALYGGWKLFGHSIYGISAPGKKPFDMGGQRGYFGTTVPPQFLFGEMALSDDYRGSPFFTGLGLE